MASRDHVSVRLSPDGLAKVQDIMAATGANRSEVIRRLLADALASDAIVKSVQQKLVDRA
jgi:metal-responsive CopG/Arc/MetJ family transcriptional regulator